MYPDLEHAKKKMYLEAAQRGDVYPVTLVMDKFNGVYSDGTWLAFNLEAEELPKQFINNDWADDAYASLFWQNHKQTDLPIGKGTTPDEAYANLIKNVILYWEHQ